MSEIQTAPVDAMTPAAVVARPRVSAEAFRNLTARLKKNEAVIPTLQVPQPIVMQPIVEAKIIPAEPAVIRELDIVEVVQAAPLDHELEIAATPLEPMELAPVAVHVDAPAIEAPVVEALAVEAPLVEAPVVEAVADSQATELSLDPAFAAATELQLKGSFEENFTLVPEPGKEVDKIDLAEIDEAVKKEVAERAIQLALENNWRLLLAKPTAEDRSQYLREAAEFHASDEDWNKPAPEFDLSQIEPAATIEETIEETAAEEVDAAVETAPFQASLPIAEGQDLAELTRSLLDMMASGNSAGLPHERALAADTLLRLVPRLELKPLVMLAQRLAMMDSPPQLLVSRLIRDPRVEVAGPLLEDCPQITDKDLEQVVQEGEPAKLRMIARRRKLSRAMSDVLVKSGEPSVVLTLVRNMEAEISHDAFQSLLLLCEDNPDLMAPLATRHDLTAPTAFELFWPAPVQLRRYILSRFLTDSETLTKILKITMATNSEEESEIEPLSQHALLEALERAARGQIEIAAEELSGIMKISSTTATRVLSDLQGDAIVVLLKTAGYPRSAVSGLLKRMQDADLPLVSRERDITELQSMFETLSFNKARILLTYWDWAQSKTGPYAPQH